MAEFQRVTEASKRRADAADRNGQRCLVENCPKDRGVVLTHVYPREKGEQKKKVRGIAFGVQCMVLRFLHIDAGSGMVLEHAKRNTPS